MTGSDATLELLGRSWDDVQGSFVEYWAEAEATVVRWAWCGPDPHQWELREPIAGDEEPMRTVDGDPGPEQRRRFARLGYDRTGDIVVARRFTDHWEGRFGGWQRGVVSAELIWVGDVLLWYGHERHGTEHHRVLLSSIARHVRDGAGRSVEMQRSGPETSSRTSYEWEGDELAGAVLERFRGALGGDACSRSRLTYERDELGLLRVRWTTELYEDVPEVVGDSGVSWFRRSPAALRMARRVVDRELPERILAWAARVAPAVPVYGLGLLWSYDAPALPPALGLGTVRERDAWCSLHGSGAELRSYLWNPAEFACFDPVPDELVDDPALQDAYALLRQDWELGANDREPAMTLRRCAKKLLATDWTDVLTPAPHFAVFVIGDELDDSLNRQLRKTVAADIQRGIEQGAS
jgi:hypothetical protein